MEEKEYNVLDCCYTVEETEEYLKNVVNNKYTQEQIQQILEALNLARHAHRNQRRCDGVPYIIHPMRVALLLLKFDKDTLTQVFIAALLHDTVEKTDVTLSTIEERFGRYVAKLVHSLTREHNERQSPQEKTKAKYQNWLEVMSASHDVRMIRVCEDLDNMICWRLIPIGSPDREKIPRWLNEAKSMSLQLAGITNLEAYQVMRQEYEYYVDRGFVHLAAAR